MTEEEKLHQDPEVALYCERTGVARRYTGLCYAHKTPWEKLDLYLPDAGEGPFPVLLDVHGGGWFYGSRSSQRMDPVLLGLQKGYAVASVDYTLSGQGGQFPLPVQELRAAVRFLRANAQTYGLDGGRIAAWGLSAGAHLSLMAFLCEDRPDLDDPALAGDGPAGVSAIVALYGPVDLAQSGGWSPQSPESLFLGAAAAAEPQKVAAADPCGCVRPGSPPCFLQYGDADELVGLQNGRLLWAALQRARTGRDYFEVLPGAKHADKLFRTPQNNEKIYAFLGRWLKP